MTGLKFDVFLLVICVSFPSYLCGMLTPRESESRSIQELNGMWMFRADRSANRNQGMDDKWWQTPLAETGEVIPMPVPSSYNDITADISLRDFVGWVWYEREFYVSHDVSKQRLVLRVDSAHYNTIVWINGKQLLEHIGGHLPFEAEANELLLASGANRLTVAVNNTLGPHTLPPGTISRHSGPSYPPGYFVQNLQFDFFNYAGIHRRVRLYSTPKVYVEDITIVTNYTDTTGHVHYDVKLGGGEDAVKVDVLDAKGKSVASKNSLSGSLDISNVKLWWPFSMSKKNFTDMYTLQVTVNSGDVYRQPFGVRTVKVQNDQILINNKRFYCHGVAKHEDSDIRGKGLDFALIARDFNMLKWLGANCFRTSHYPYAEEIMDEADRWGIAVIDECPGVGIKSDANFANESLTHHLEVMTELVTRDKNRPSVFMWSVANEPDSTKSVAGPYFKTVIEHTRDLDPTRLVTFVTARGAHDDKAAQYTDVQCVNRYYGWYQNSGHLETIKYALPYDLQEWYKTHPKPYIISEYGADTVPGLHTMPAQMFTEDYQVDFLREHHHVFDDLKKTFLSGEMVWNFADFMTVQTTTRVVGNKKGLLTRTRQPKASAHVISMRYWSLIKDQQLNESEFSYQVIDHLDNEKDDRLMFSPKN